MTKLIRKFPFHFLLQLLIYFVPKMNISTQDGLFLTIQSSDNNTAPSLSSTSEMKELLDNLLTNRSVSNKNNKNSLMGIELSNVILNKCKQMKSDNKNKHIILSTKEIAEDILENVQRKRKIINISEERNQAAVFFDYVKNKFKRNRNA